MTDNLYVDDKLPDELPTELHTDDQTQAKDTLATEKTDENVAEEPEEEIQADEESTEEPTSKGMDKRLARVLEREEELRQRLWEKDRELERLRSNAPQPNYQQTMQPQAQLDPRLDPASPNWDFELYQRNIIADEFKRQMAIEKQNASLQEFANRSIQELKAVDNTIYKTRALDSNFDKQMERYGVTLTDDMKYGLSALKNPGAFLRHVFKNEKDVRMLEQISKKHPAEQLRAMTKLGLEFELSANNRSVTTSTPKSKPIPVIGKGSNPGLKSAYDPNTGKFDRDWVDKNFAY